MVPPAPVVRRIAAVVALFAAVGAARVSAANAPPGHYVVGAGPTANTVTDTRTKLTWQRSVSTTTYAWSATKGACAGLALDGTGWRVPTITELTSLVDFAQSSGPYIDTAAFPGTPPAKFWSATPVVGNANSAWPIDFNSGGSQALDVSTAAYVRCVR